MKKNITSGLGATGIVKKVATGIVLGAIALEVFGSAPTTNRGSYPIIDISSDPESYFQEQKTAGVHGRVWDQLY